MPEHREKCTLLQRRDYLEAAMDSLPKYGALSPRSEVCNMELWCECFGRRKEEMRRTDSFEISAMMEKIEGWGKEEKIQRMRYYGRQRFYVRQNVDEKVCEQLCEQTPGTK